jgi:hypothetical protein
MEIIIYWISDCTEIRPVRESIGYQTGMAPDQGVDAGLLRFSTLPPMGLLPRTEKMPLSRWHGRTVLCISARFRLHESPCFLVE